MRIAFLLHSLEPNNPQPHISPVTGLIIDYLRNMGVRVNPIVPQCCMLEEIALGRPSYDLYVLKSQIPFNLSLAGALTLTGARVVNSVRACMLTQDRIIATATLAAAGIPTPPSWATGQREQLSSLLTTSALWVKPHCDRGDGGITRVSVPSELEQCAPCSDAYGLPLPIIAQQEIPSSGQVLKVYVVGQQVWAIERPFPAQTLADKIGKPISLSKEISTAALRCGQALGLEIYGVDFLVTQDQFYAVDINAFPGYKGISDAPYIIASYLYERAHNSQHHPYVKSV